MNYGVELEFVFAFHEDELPSETNIKKDLDYATRERYPEFTPTKLKDHVYNSWGILEDGASEPRAVIIANLSERHMLNMLVQWRATNDFEAKPRRTMSPYPYKDIRYNIRFEEDGSEPQVRQMDNNSRPHCLRSGLGEYPEETPE